MKSKYSQLYQSTLKSEKQAVSLRHNQTSAEKLLWEMLRNRQIKNLKFRRQHPVGPFIADFYCHDLKLVVELDGFIHQKQKVKMNDRLRQKHIEENGITVLRFSNDDVFEYPGRIIQSIISIL